MLKLVSILMAILTISPAFMHAQSTPSTSQTPAIEVPPLIRAGMNAYKEKGPEEALREWIKDSPLDGSKEALSQVNNLRQVQDYYGAYQNFDMVSKHEYDSRVIMYYLIMNYEKGPLFCKFLLYKSDHGWILMSFKFNASIDAIFPQNN